MHCVLCYYILLVVVCSILTGNTHHEIAFLVAQKSIFLSKLTRPPPSLIDMAPRLEIRPAKLLKATAHVVPGESSRVVDCWDIYLLK